MPCDGCKSAKCLDLKLLRCFHAICRPCVELYLHSDNVVVCPECGGDTKSPGEGRNQVLSLPSVDDASFRLSQEAEEKGSSASPTEGIIRKCSLPQCMECGGEDAATSYCVECSLFMCSGYKDAHANGKRTKDHSVETVGMVPDGEPSDVVATAAAASAASAGHGPKSAVWKIGADATCPLHNSVAVKYFCSTCKNLLCRICQTSGAHDDHQEAVRPLKEAAVEQRKLLHQALGTSPGQEQGEALRAYRQTVQGLLDSTKARCFQVSADIKAEAARCISVLEEEREQCIREADSVLLEKCKELERERAVLDNCLRICPLIGRLLRLCSNDVDLLKMSSWLMEAHREQETVASVNHPPVGGFLSFTPSRQLSLGKVENLNVDPGSSMMRCDKKHAGVNSEVMISLTLKSSTGEAAQFDYLLEMGFSVTVQSPAKSTRRTCKLAGVSGTVRAPIHLRELGDHTVHACFGKKHITGSPLRVRAIDTFSSKPQPGISLKQQNLSAELTGDIACAHAYGNSSFREGVVSYRIKIVQMPGKGGIFLGFSGDEAEVVGWNSDNGCAHKLNGKQLGAEWRAGDEFVFELDFGNRRVRGTHCREDLTYTAGLAVPNQPMKLVVSLFDATLSSSGSNACVHLC